jgi:hypothetical protein
VPDRAAWKNLAITLPGSPAEASKPGAERNAVKVIARTVRILSQRRST